MNSVRRRFTPSVPLTLEFENEQGKESISLRLAYNFNAFAAIEEKIGLNMLRGELFKDLNVTKLIAAFWAALLVHQPEFANDNGYASVGEMVTMENSATVLAAVRQAFILSLSKDQRETVEKKEAEAKDGSPLEPAPAQ